MTIDSFSSRHPFVFYWVLGIIFQSFSGCQTGNNNHEELNHQVYASLIDSTSYVGMETCRQCHSDIYNSYIQTGMGQSFDLARRIKSSAIFDHHSLIIDSVNGFRYHPFWMNDSLYVTEFLLEGLDTVFKRTEKINYIIGSGQHTNSHIRNVNGYLYQAPLTFYTQQSRWDLPPGYEDGFNSRFSRKIELECMSCHNAMPELVPGSENKYISVPNGIDCERCHGPGSKHVQLKRAGVRTDTSRYIDYSIVNPSKLSIDLQMDVCQRCHIQGNAVLNEGKSFTDFRPGMALSSVMNVYMPVYEGDPDAHIMASHAERLKMSSCFIESLKHSGSRKDTASLKPYKNAITCITCHNPHISVKQTGIEVYNNACKSCHSPGAGSHDRISGSDCKGDVKIRLSVLDNCVSCHMPKSGPTDIPHVTTTDHFIRKPVSKKELTHIREFVGLVSINNPQADKLSRAKAYINYYEKFTANPAFLDSARSYLSDASSNEILKNFKTLVHWAYLKQDYNLVIRYAESAWNESGFVGKIASDNSDAWTAYRIGQSYQSNGDVMRALKYYKQATTLAPYQPDFRNKLASVQHDSGKLKEAKENYRFIIHENPEYVPAYTNLGFLMLTEDGDPQSAQEMYLKALALDPMNEQALLNQAGLLIHLEAFSEANKYLKKLLKINPGHRQAAELSARIERLVK